MITVTDENGQPVFELQAACQLCGRPIHQIDEYRIDGKYHCIFCYNAIRAKNRKYIDFYKKDGVV